MRDRTKECDEQRAVYESAWNADAERRATYAIVSAVASAEGRDITDLPPLYEAIDPDALNTLMSPTAETGADRIVFRYCGYEIEVDKTGVELHVPTVKS